MVPVFEGTIGFIFGLVPGHYCLRAIGQIVIVPWLKANYYTERNVNYE